MLKENWFAEFGGKRSQLRSPNCAKPMGIGRRERLPGLLLLLLYMPAAISLVGLKDYTWVFWCPRTLPTIFVVLKPFVMGLRALVVGGTNGIGNAMACRVAAEAPTSTVTISGRNKPERIPHPNIDFRPLDATSMSQIKSFTDAFKSALTQQLDVLIMTQGIMTIAGRMETAEGIDRKMALHYFGKQLLIRELLPAMSAAARVVIVFDGRFGNPAKLHWEDLDLKDHFSLSTAANHCMVMNDIMIQHHAQNQQGTEKRHFVHAWPGGVNSSLFRELPWYFQPIARVAGKLVGVEPSECAKRLLDGVSTCTAAGEPDGRLWSNIGNKGELIKGKAIWTEEKRLQVAEHTWSLVDGAIQRHFQA